MRRFDHDYVSSFPNVRCAVPFFSVLEDLGIIDVDFKLAGRDSVPPSKQLQFYRQARGSNARLQELGYM